MGKVSKIKVGILFGGSSREREISFAGGRTVYDNLDKTLFEPVLLFMDPFHKLIQLDWPYIYKGSIRDFFPVDQSAFDREVYAETAFNSAEDEAYMQDVFELGQPVSWEDLPEMIDLAFLCLHGESGEDGQVQGALQLLHIPYTGSGLFPSALGMNKALQKKLFPDRSSKQDTMAISRKEWLNEPVETYERLLQQFDFPLVVRPANQGSSIGVTIVHSERELASALDMAFFILRLSREEWKTKSQDEKKQWAYQLVDLRNELGYPILIEEEWITTPESLVHVLDRSESQEILLRSAHTEHTAVVESFIAGREFSCIVLRAEDGTAQALPPTEILKGGEVYDYRSKYLPGLSRKQTPMDLPEKEQYGIRQRAVELFEDWGFHVYARIDGFYKADGSIILNDPNTTSGMLPSSFFFHQAAEVGFTPKGFISYIIGQSLHEYNQRALRRELSALNLKKKLERLLTQKETDASQKIRVAVILGGYSSERHISVESGRNIFEKLSSSEKYLPEPIFLTGGPGEMKFYRLPMNLLLKDNADDIAEALEHTEQKWIGHLRKEMKNLVGKYQSDRLVSEAVPISIEQMSQQYDFGFIALHGRPGEDGQLQKLFEEHQLPFNGSGWESAAVTIDKYETGCRLRAQGIATAQQAIIEKVDALNGQLDEFNYPLIAKPVDDGCSSAVKLIQDEKELQSYLQAIFREEASVSDELSGLLGLLDKEEFPRKKQVLIEERIDAGGAWRFLEITGGLMTEMTKDGRRKYTIFHPSEAVASLGILSLEEKFLAGEGTNITPPRYHPDPELSAEISEKVKQELLRVAQILDVEGYARIDAFVRIFDRAQVELIVIEVNSLPGMTPATAIFHQAALEKLKPVEFIDKIIAYGLQKAAYDRR